MQATQQSSVTVIRRSVLRRWPVVALVTLIALVASIVAISGRERSYEASAQLLIVPLSQDNQIFFGTGLLRDAGDPSLTADSAAQVLHTEDIARATAKSLTKGTTATSVLKDVRVRPTPETNVLSVTATADSRAGAEQLATAYVNAALTTRADLARKDIQRRIKILLARDVDPSDEQLSALRATLDSGTDPTIQLAQPTGPTTAVSHTPAVAIVILALLGGLFIGVLAAVGIERLSGRVRDTDDAKRLAAIPVWGEAPAVPRPLRHAAVAPSRLPGEALDGLRPAAVHIGQSSPEGATVVLTSAGNADGRTTTAVGLAVELARQGRSIALLLLDPVDDVTRNDVDSAGVKVVDAGAGSLAKSLEQAHVLADLVLVDGPPLSRGADLITALLPARLVLVVRADHTLRQDLAASFEILRELGAKPVGMVVLGVRT